MAEYYAREGYGERCICAVSGDTVGLVSSNLNCDGARIRNLAGATIDWAIAKDGVIALQGSQLQSVDTDYITVLLSSIQTAPLGGEYRFQVRATDNNGNVTTIGCGCVFFNESIL